MLTYNASLYSFGENWKNIQRKLCLRYGNRSLDQPINILIYEQQFPILIYLQFLFVKVQWYLLFYL